ncbi:Phosphoacetylglucosamine Mutase [Geranomyces variabilis]|uniref:Phosphoacetylglucosamine mutase n=1 Tax=Geranomyces variabilis TaxID=109894 RepID=A0AAD5XRT4_9FUNG|nr:Phosphoacetylglucosamine Mutase [Geranomyces variabilis]
MTLDKAKINGLFAKHPKLDVTYTYGTAGFRTKGDVLDSVMFSVGLLAVLRSKKHAGKVIGAMVTASHNPAVDNGVKLVEPMGEMLAQSWETYATVLANAATTDALVAGLEDIVKKEQIDLAQPANVIIARDTRPSGTALVAALTDGVSALGGKITDKGLLTTPQLHYITRCLNTNGAYGEPTEEGYYKKLADAFKRIVTGKPKLSPLYVDGANGIGAPALQKLAKHLSSDLSVNVVNDDTATASKLNLKSGADFVKVGQKKPDGFDLKPGMRCASLDGDADRIVFWYANQEGTFKLLDGDKIATLAASFIMELVKEAKVPNINVGLVQTAYANGSATAYVKDTLQVPVVFTATGVKHLHHAAEEFDVGVYFEANGHGTVLFSPAAIKAFHTTDGSTDAQKRALETLRALTDLINQTVGDALSDLLMVEAILVSKNKSFSEWDSDYSDLASRLEKVTVSNRLEFVAVKADTELSKPEGLQAKINQQMAKFKHGRSFVRPSGTEDVVRVYAEAATQADADLLAAIVCGIIFDHHGGVGTRPAGFKKVDKDGNVVA